MAHIIAINGGSLTIQVRDPRSLMKQLSENILFSNLKESIEASGLDSDFFESEDDNFSTSAVFYVGRELLPDRYICKGEVLSLSMEIPGADSENTKRLLDQAEKIIIEAGYAPIRVHGIILNHFD